MRVYKYTNLEYCKPWSFKLGTLYDYRNEEAYGKAIGDKNEGSHQLLFKTKHTPNDQFFENMLKNQSFGFAYVKGEKEKYETFYALTSSNVLVFSVTAKRNDGLYEEFKGTNCCVAINDFYAFSKLLVKNIKSKVEKWEIRRCSYGDKEWQDADGVIPSLPFYKSLEYQHQDEVRLCIQLIPQVEVPIYLNLNGVYKFCKVIHTAV